MIFLPYSTALRLSKAPVITYSMVLVCTAVYLLQTSLDITGYLAYFPQSWNPVKMISSAFAHGSWFHLIGNMIFYLAFAPALEALIGSKLRYLGIMLAVSLVVSICYSISTLAGNSLALPSSVEIE